MLENKRRSSYSDGNQIAKKIKFNAGLSPTYNYVLFQQKRHKTSSNPPGFKANLDSGNCLYLR